LLAVPLHKTGNAEWQFSHIGGRHVRAFSDGGQTVTVVASVTISPVEDLHMNRIIRFINDEQGADLIEYALLVGLIALAMTASLTATRTAIEGLFTTVQNSITSAGQQITGGGGGQ
jgi:Flp pilus assembly pilin Flp